MDKINIIKSRWIIAILAIFLSFNSGNASLSETIRLSGSSTVSPVMLEISKSYEKKFQNVRVIVGSGGSGKGISDLRKGLVDIAMLSRPLNADEEDLNAHIIARDGIAVLIGADNPVSNLSREQVRAIFTGEITNWNEIAGGSNHPIVVVSKGEGSATSEVLNRYLGLKSNEIAAELVAAENAQIIKTVSSTPGSIGYVSIGGALVEIKLGAPVKLLGIGKAAPTLESIANGSYEVTRPLNLVTIGTPGQKILKLLNYSSSPDVSEIIQSLTFADVSQRGAK